MTRRGIFNLIAGIWVVAFSLAWAYAMFMRMYMPRRTVTASAGSTVVLVHQEGRVGLARQISISVSGPYDNHYAVRAPVLITSRGKYVSMSPANSNFVSIREHRKWEVYEGESKTDTLHWLSLSPYEMQAATYRIAQRIGPWRRSDKALAEMIFSLSTNEVELLKRGQQITVPCKLSRK